jgi:hypothetical protein
MGRCVVYMNFSFSLNLSIVQTRGLVLWEY